MPVDAPTSSRAVAQPRRGKRAGHTWGSRRRSVRILLEQDATVTGRPTPLAASTTTAASRPGLESRRLAPTKGAGANRVLDLLSVRVAPTLARVARIEDLRIGDPTDRARVMEPHILSE